MPKYPRSTHVEIAPAYVAELRRRVNAIGFREVARVGKMGLATLWRVLADDADQHPTLDAVERVRAAVAKAAPDAPPVPPPVLAIEGAEHAAWCEIGAELVKADPGALAALLTAPRRRALAELRGALARLRDPALPGRR
jgi:hypothetical protein